MGPAELLAFKGVSEEFVSFEGGFRCVFSAKTY